MFVTIISMEGARGEIAAGFITTVFAMFKPALLGSSTVSLVNTPESTADHAARLVWLMDRRPRVAFG